ncbi:MAG: thiamine pyrophosphate-binding protein [Gemmataceae bacterium]|nr:thiamine pyrophosphate-binding protein [Gemmataceae bacterium]
MSSKRASTGADVLVQRLEAQGVQHIFGYPGGQLTPIYDALVRQSTIRHILARDEQAAAFMADGYARATGQPGVCLAVCGPGVFNAATPLATSFTDSIPVLVISGQVPLKGLGLRSGYYHENEQMLVCETLTKARMRSESVRQMASDVNAAFKCMTSRRPGPVLLEVPVDVLRDDDLTLAEWPVDQSPYLPEPPLALRSGDIASLAKLMSGWQRPLLMVGGGVIAAGAESLLIQLAQRLGAPVFHTLMGKAAFPSDHPLAAGLPWSRATSDLTQMGQYLSPLFAEADGMLAIGCRFSQAATGTWTLKPPPSLAQIDVDRAELGRHYPVAIGVHADAKDALSALLAVLPDAPWKPWAETRPPREPWRLPGLDLVGPLRRALPRDAIVAADITRLSYILLAEFPVYERRTFLHPAGFVPMGYGIPAALGAKAAFPNRTVVTVVGDGCFAMCAMELATAVQEELPIVVVLINDGSLSLIKAIQQRKYEGRFLGVDLHNPDFGLFAQAFGVRFWIVDSDAKFESALVEAIDSGVTSLIEVRL